MHSNNERAVSDVVAFALVFGMVITIVSATFVLGMDSIEALGNDGQMQTADQQMDAVGATFDDIHRRGSVTRSVEIELDGGTLEHVESDITINDGSDSTYPTNSLELRRDQGVVAYELGAIVRQNGDGSGGLVRREPAISCREIESGEYRVFVSIVELKTSSSSFSVAGQDSVRIIGRLDSQEVVESEEYGTNKQVTISLTGGPLDPSNAEAFRNYLERADNWYDTGSGDEFRCGSSTPPNDVVSEIIVRKTVITLEIRR